MALSDYLPILEKLHFDLISTYHAEVILEGDFSGALAELDHIIGAISIPIIEIVKGGGGEAHVTQRLRRSLKDTGWEKWNFNVQKSIDGVLTYSSSHEVDHVKRFARGTLALEIEWNNKDPFYDRDLESFQRLHADGAISAGIIVTRGSTFQSEILARIESFAFDNEIEKLEDLASLHLHPTPRQQKDIINATRNGSVPFSQAWAGRLVADKFASSTTHWEKLRDRLNRGVGSPCPVIGIGIPIAVVK